MDNIDGSNGEGIDGPPAPHFGSEAQAEVVALAERGASAKGVLLRASNYVGGKVEDSLNHLPDNIRTQLEDAAHSALRQSYQLAAKSRGGIGEKIGSDRLHKALGTLTGVIGGFGGFPTALAEVPVITTVFFRAVQNVAAEYGEDTAEEETRLACLAVFGGNEDEMGLSLTGVTLSGMVTKVAPRFAAVLSQKLATQSVPVIGAAAGAGANYAFVDYYVTLAHVHFGLRKLSRLYGEDIVRDAFEAASTATDD